MRSLTLCLALLLLFGLGPVPAAAQQFDLAPSARSDPAELARVMPELAKQALAAYTQPDRARYLEHALQLQLAARDFAAAKDTIAALRRLSSLRRIAGAATLDAEYLLYAEAKLLEAERNLPFDDAYRQTFRASYETLGDRDAVRVGTALTTGLTELQDVRDVLAGFKGKERLELADVVALADTYGPYLVANGTSALAAKLVRADADRRFVIRDDVLIKARDGALLSAVVVRKRGVAARQPAALIFTIYADIGTAVRRMQYAAARGYVGVTAFTRGKAHSPNAIVPYEDDGRDANDVIDWIARQPWSNHQVGMYGGSYNGFTQWAAAKWANPVLKTIVPYAANNPGNGLPMENNIFILANYAWPFYVTDNKYLDDAAYSNKKRWTLNERWYASGRPYRDVDAIDGTPNPWYHRWLAHPSFDAYWQRMVPYQRDFARITIPVLTVTGYYDDGQGSALNFLKDHYAYNPHAEHYLVIGPYDHLGTGRPHKDEVLRGYQIDPVAQIDTPEITFAWLDYVMRGGVKPALLRDKINYEVMGANVWRHAPSLATMSSSKLTLYLSTRKAGARRYQLSAQAPSAPGALLQTVDLADRKTENNSYYPFPIVGKKPNLANGFTFVSAPFTEPVSLSGAFTGKLRIVINKRDLDVGVVLYELMPDGRLFQLSYFTGRASYASDPSVRTLLRPGVATTIAFDRTRVVSRRMNAGSRLLFTLNVNKNQYAQINYGTGKDVSAEDTRDAKVPLKIRWLAGSLITIPVSRIPTAIAQR